MLRSLLIIILILSYGCSTSQTKNQCKDLDWAKVGLGHAYDGISYEAGLGYYQKSCGIKHGISVNQREYQRGYKYGLEQFCDTSNAAIWGLQGKKYSGICPKNKEKRFLASYSKGYNKYLQNQVESLNKTIQILEDEVKRLKSKTSKNSTTLLKQGESNSQL
jgi:Protein of unknown function (DUF2799)